MRGSGTRAQCSGPDNKVVASACTCRFLHLAAFVIPKQCCYYCSVLQITFREIITHYKRQAHVNQALQAPLRTPCCSLTLTATLLLLCCPADHFP